MKMARVKDREFWESARYNNGTFLQYYNRLAEIGFSRFQWNNLPETVDERFLEMVLFGDGKAVFFKDDVLGFLALRVALNGRFNVYQIPINRTAYASNGYQIQLTEENSVIIFNNYTHTNCVPVVEQFAARLYNIDRTIDVNVNAQKTPLLLLCDENQRLTLKNLYMQYEGNMPFIFATKELGLDSIRSINTGAQYIADKLTFLKSQIWNEAMTYLGIPNISVNKKERLISDEVQKNQGGTIASRYSPLEMRRQAAEQINRMFGLEISVDFRTDIAEDTEAPEDAEEGDFNE